MIFSEIYGEYFNAVAKILDTAVRGELNENDIISIVGESAFGESILSPVSYTHLTLPTICSV